MDDQMDDQFETPEARASWDKFKSSVLELFAQPVPFQCSGTTKLDEPLALLAMLGEKTIGVKFPLPSESEADALKPMIDLCEPAVFGRGKENVLDPTYRDALVLPTKTVGLVSPSFSLNPILSIVEKLLLTSHEQLEGKRIKAVFEKCNIYAKGGFFGPHADTPRGQGMFASLVLILPGYFSGGELVLRRKNDLQSKPTSENQKEGDTEITDDVEEYSFGCGDPTHLKWIAFFSDTEHEVKPVTDGSRVTVTYNLCSEDVFLPPPLVKSPAALTATVPIYEILINSLKDPNFLPDGHEIGIYCKNNYVLGTEENAKAVLERLRGIDLWVYKALEHLANKEVSNITYTMHFVIHPEDDDEVILPVRATLSDYEDDMNHEEPIADMVIKDGGRRVRGTRRSWYDDEENVTILNSSSWGLKLNYMEYGNEYTFGYEYASIIFLINIPSSDVRFN